MMYVAEARESVLAHLCYFQGNIYFLLNRISLNSLGKKKKKPFMLRMIIRCLMGIQNLVEFNHLFDGGGRIFYVCGKM